jgi:type II secretion system protein N
VKARLIKIAKYAAYPLLYLFCLLFFFYLTFPMHSLKGRIVAEFDRQQRYGRPAGEPAMKLEIGDISTYWFTGVELKDVRLTVPPRVEKPKGGSPLLDLAPKDAAPAKPSVLVLDRIRARVRMLPLLVGNVKLDFRVDAFGGRIEGTAPFASPGNVEVEIAGVHLENIEPLRAMVQGQPIFGVAKGSVLLAPEEGKFAKASGKVELAIDDVVMFDGKTKLMGVALPAANIGRITLLAKAEKGQLSIEELSAQGQAIELLGEGRIRLAETYKRSMADIYLKFKFTDGYRNKDDATRSLLGEPGKNFPPVIELDPAKTFVRAKTDDGFYRFHLVGPLDRLEPQPSGNASGKKGPSRPKFGDFAGERRDGMRGGDTPTPTPAQPSPPPAPENAVRSLPGPAQLGRSGSAPEE